MPGSSPVYAFLCRRCILAQAALVVDEISTRICEITVLERLHICALSSARWEELLDYYDFSIVASGKVYQQFDFRPRTPIMGEPDPYAEGPHICSFSRVLHGILHKKPVSRENVSGSAYSKRDNYLYLPYRGFWN